MQYKVIIPASGTGTRFGGKTPKQFIRLGAEGNSRPHSGREVLAYTIGKFHSMKQVSEIVIATHKNFIPKVKKIVKQNKFTKVTSVVAGGKTRQDSVYNALKVMNSHKNDTVLVHDAVRPFVTRRMISRILAEMKHHNAVIPGLKINDTLKKVSKNDYVVRTEPRENIWRVQTPQAFRYGLLMKAYNIARRDKFNGTDEASLIEHANYKVRIIEGERTNIKITTKDDLKVVDYNKLLK